MIKIIITDDHPIFRRGIKQILGECFDIEIVNEAKDSNELFEILKKTKCDILLLDISLPGKNGLEILNEVSEFYKNIKVLVLG